MKILLVRGDGIGDALVCAPLVAALRDAGHELGALLSTRNRHAFAQRAFARVHVLERIPWPRHGSTRATYATALAQARAVRYDVALVASEEMEAYAFARGARIAARVGFINGLEKPLKSLRVRRLLTRALVRPASAASANEHEVRTLFRLGNELHAEAEPSRDVARLRALLLDAPVSAHGAIALAVSDKLARAGLDEAAYVAIALELRRRGEVALVLGDDPELVTRIGRAAGSPVACGLDTRTWVARLAGARVVITPDSAAAHVAGFCGVPCVDLFAPGAATASDIVRWRPWLGSARPRVLDVTRSAAQLAQDVGDDVAALTRAADARP